MKINEIPKKIYLSYETDDEDDKDHIFIDYMWHIHPCEGKNLKNVEYVRTDAFIDEACSWFADRYQVNGSYLCADDIEDFVKFMEGK